MLKASLRYRILPRNAWRIALVMAALAMPLRHGFHAIAADAPAAAAKSEAVKKTNAAGLIEEMEKGIAVIGKATKDAKIDPKAKVVAPFYASLGKVTKGTGDLKKQLAAKDPAYFKTMIDTAKAIGEMRVTAPRIGVVNKQINNGTKIVFESFDALNDNFGAGAARKKQGGELTDKEKAALAKLQTQQKAAVAKLKPLQEKARKAGNKKLAADLGALIRQASAIAGAKSTLDSYLKALRAYDYLAGEYATYYYYLPADYRTDWSTIDTYYVYTQDVPVTTVDWSYYETSEYSYEYDYTEVSMSETEIEEYAEETEEYDAEVADDTYVEEDDYEEALDENEDEQDDTWEDDEEAAEEDSADEEDDSADEEDDSADEEDDSADEEDDSADEEDDSADEEDDSGDEEDDSADEEDDSGDEEDDSGDDGGDDDGGGDEE
jgi:hypothetical protein